MSSEVPASLRQLVAERAAYRCEYCLLPQAVALHQHEPDHICRANIVGKPMRTTSPWRVCAATDTKGRTWARLIRSRESSFLCLIRARRYGRLTSRGMGQRFVLSRLKHE